MSTRKAFPLRIREDIYEALQHWADDEFRSVNAQIEFLLREALRRAGRLRGEGDDDAAKPAGEPPAG